MNKSLNDIARALRNVVRVGVVAVVDADKAMCRVQTGEILTNWLPWLAVRAGRLRSWSAPSVGEQVLLLSLGGELDTAFILPGIYSDDCPAPSRSPDALHIVFADGAALEYEPESGALSARGIKTATVQASGDVTVKAQKITLDAPQVICTQVLKAASLEITQGGKMFGNIEHSGGALVSNGKTLHSHTHRGDSGGQTGGPL